MAYTMDTTMGDILSNPEAVKVLDELMPGASTNPMMKMAKGFSLGKISKTPAAKVSVDQVQQLIDALNAKLG
ncbi:MAG: hypothetical protein CVU91_13070 [Firmicutes bacterium HGW-Firmicutes-16]|nr:MAG: hypothetical protein CVU91_13070 [Firmicutes bacterium HGW-Firmicutes-16]